MDVAILAAILGAIAGAFIGFVGSLLVFGVTEFVTEKKEKRARNEKIASTHLLLRLEAQHNIDTLRQTWERVTQGTADAVSDEGESARRGARFAVEHLPAWQTLMWTSHAAFLDSALKQHEISALFELYASLEVITQIHRKMTYLREEHDVYNRDRGPIRDPDEVNSSEFRFSRALEVYYRDCEAIVVKTLDTGNPLGRS